MAIKFALKTEPKPAVGGSSPTKPDESVRPKAKADGEVQGGTDLFEAKPAAPKRRKKNERRFE
ncbi:MAG: hypothetical protein ACRECY_13560 [Phyllobacterium sp.]